MIIFPLESTKFLSPSNSQNYSIFPSSPLVIKILSLTVCEILVDLSPDSVIIKIRLQSIHQHSPETSNLIISSHL